MQSAKRHQVSLQQSPRKLRLLDVTRELDVTPVMERSPLRIYERISGRIDSLSY